MRGAAGRRRAPSRCVGAPGCALWRAVRSSSLAPVPSLAHVPLKPRCGASRWAHTPHSHTFPAFGPAQAHATVVRRDRAGNAPLALVSAHGRRAASRRQAHQSRAATDSATPLHHVPRGKLRRVSGDYHCRRLAPGSGVGLAPVDSQREGLCVEYVCLWRRSSLLGERDSLLSLGLGCDAASVEHAARAPRFCR